MTHTVGEVARLAGVTIRALHHYDEIGLVVAGRTASGHRTYDTATLERLQQVMFFKELEFPLDTIKEIMADQAFDRQAALTQQRAMLFGKIERLRSVLDALDLALLAQEERITMSANEMFDQTQYEDEAKRLWGDTNQYRQSQQRTKGFGRQDWSDTLEEASKIAARFADLKRAGSDPDSPEALALAEEHRQHINRFYECSPSMHTALADMYVSDARFSDYWDNFEPGLSDYVNTAIHANSDGV